MLKCACVRNDEAGAESALFFICSPCLGNQGKKKNAQLCVHFVFSCFFLSLRQIQSVLKFLQSALPVLVQYSLVRVRSTCTNFLIRRIHSFFQGFFIFFFCPHTKCSAQFGRSSSLRHDCRPVSRLWVDVRTTPKPHGRAVARLISQSGCHRKSMHTKVPGVLKHNDRCFDNNISFFVCGC